MMERVARMTADGGQVLCGGCKTIRLCSRVWLDRGAIGKGFFLVWDEGWYVEGDHIKRSPGSWLRPKKGYAPTRRAFLVAADRSALSRALREYWPAECACGTRNRINPKRLRVLGVAPHS